MEILYFRILQNHRQFTKRAHCLLMVNRTAVIQNKVATVSNKFLQSHLIN